jgi:phosphoesterase RecJ-like protein
MTEETLLDTRAERQALDLLLACRKPILAGHVRPDGDCIGAQAALYRVLTALGKEAYILNPDPPEPQFDYLSNVLDYDHWKGGELPEHDLVVLLDCAELSRCGALGEAFGRSPAKKVVIDHHIHQEGEWWDASYRDLSCAATGLLVRRIARDLKVELDEVAAHGVFTSIVTDTGWFKYSNTDAETLQAASELVSRGVDPSRIYNAIYQRHSAEQPALLGRALQLAEYHADGRLAFVGLPVEASGKAMALDGDDLLDILRAVGRVEIVLLLRELPDGTCKLSARSKTDYDVQQLARRFGGGGHAKAAGATFRDKLAVSRERLLAAALEGFSA